MKKQRSHSTHQSFPKFILEMFPALLIWLQARTNAVKFQNLYCIYSISATGQLWSTLWGALCGPFFKVVTISCDKTQQDATQKLDCYFIPHDMFLTLKEKNTVWRKLDWRISETCVSFFNLHSFQLSTNKVGQQNHC